MYSATDVIWVLIAAILVFFMQAGFALCEAGLTRAKNTGNILMKNMMDFCIGTPCFWLVGFGIMFAGTGPWIGGFDPLIRGTYDFGTLPTWCYAIFQTVFCATAATIVSGSMAERTNFKAYCIYSAAISLIVYPISGHWIWGGGWLSSLGFHHLAFMILQVPLVYIWLEDWSHALARQCLGRVSENTIKTEKQERFPGIISWRWRSVCLSSGSAGLDLTEDPQLQ